MLSAVLGNKVSDCAEESQLPQRQVTIANNTNVQSTKKMR